MKRTRIILPVFLISLLPFSFISGQEKKNEEKIKIIIADDSGTNVVIDTTFTSDNKLDSIKLKDGTYVYIGNHPDEESLAGDNVVVYSHSADKNAGHEKRYKVITRVGKGDDKSNMNYIYVNDDKEAGRDSDEKFDIRLNEDEYDHNTDNTKHVIAKNGIVVTIEGSDETKINKLVREIEKSLDIDTRKPVAKPAVK